ncbi:unnamed protein product [Plutella xylostella]|uniref:(diamondback moth) hypothetical protein n=1 Tax=Plutella xylostella TaxID=51655 RepID=A0A8S4G8F7_PLUXY|nr:unnamed protein product [Plutella xylostella]
MRLVVPGIVGDVRAVPALRVLGLVAAMALYLAMGAAVFQQIERPLELELEGAVHAAKQQFLMQHPAVSGE